MKYKQEIAKQAINSRSGKAIPPKVSNTVGRVIVFKHSVSVTAGVACLFCYHGYQYVIP